MAKISHLLASIVLTATVVIISMLIGAKFISPNAGNIQSGATGGTDGAADGGVDCQNAPTVTLSAVDAELQGTSVSPTSKYIVNGVYKSGTPTLVVGDKVRILANLSSYIDVLSEEKTMVCGGNPIDVKMYDYAAPTIQIKEDSTTLTDNAAGGVSNATAIAVGSSDTYRILMTPSNNDATGNLVMVVELSTNANVSSITVSDSKGDVMPAATVPTHYPNTLTSPYVKAFALPNMVDAVEREYKMTIQAKDSAKIQGAVYTTYYVHEPFVDTDGKVITDIKVVEDAQGTDKSEANVDYDFWITA